MTTNQTTQFVTDNLPEKSNLLFFSKRDLILLERCRSLVLIIENGKVLYVNSTFLNSFSSSKSDFQDVNFEKIVHPTGYEQICYWMISESFKNNNELILDIQLSADGKNYKWFNGVFSLSKWENRDVISGFLIDIEEKKRKYSVEQQLRQAQKMEAVGRLAGGLAHDMNNTLGAILGFASVIDAEIDPESRTKKDIKQILKACHKGRNLMLNLLGFARQGKYRRQSFSVNELVFEVIDLLKHSISKKIMITSNIQDDSLEVCGDPTQIHHAVMNLCLNAIDAMGKTGILSIVLDSEYISLPTNEETDEEQLEEGQYVRIAIGDTGKGMDEHVLDMAFEPFFTTKPIGEGSGLGLPMVYGTIKNHGGAVKLESILDKGTVATILLPVATSNQSKDTNYEYERKTPSNATEPLILLVDDEEMIRHAGKRVLEKLGYKVLLACDGQEGLRIFSEKKEKLAAIVLDLMMPIMDGEETFRRIRQISFDVPILLSSGYSKEEKADTLVALGADGFIQKPFDMSTLKSTLLKILPS